MGVQVGFRLQNGNSHRQPVTGHTYKALVSCCRYADSASPSLRCYPDNGFATKMTNDTRLRSGWCCVSARR
jgi:hypothetical protein